LVSEFLFAPVAQQDRATVS